MRKITFFRNLIVLVALLVGSGSAMGQTNFTWNFGTSTGVATPSGSLSELSVGAISIGNTNGTVTMLSTTSASSGYTGSSGQFNAGNAARVGALVVGASGSAYFEFTVTPASGYKFSLNSISFGTRSTSTAPQAYTLRSSVDSYATDIATGSITANSSWQLKTNAGLTFGTTDNSSVTFRLYGYNGSGSAGVNTINWRIDDLIISLTANSIGGAEVVAAPTFNPTSGTYFTTQNVTISTETEGATIRYTTNGDEPTESSAIFSTPISVSATTTIKAKAFKAEMDPSATATATYVLPTEVANLGAMRSGGPGVYRITGEVLLTLKSATRNAKYVQDATGAVLIDDPSGTITTSFNIGDGITGLVGTTSINTGMLNFTPAADPGAATSTNNIINPVEIELSELGNNEARLVKVSGVTINGEGNFTTTPTNYNLNGSNNPVLRTHYNDLDYIGTAIPSVPQDIVGVVLKFNTTNQLVPRSLAEMTNTVFTSPTIMVAESSVSPMSAQIETTDDATITVNATNLNGNITLAVTGDDADLFSLSTYSITQTDGSVSDVVVTITYAPLEAGSHSALLTLSSDGAEDVTRSLSGTATEPSVPITAPNVIITEVYGGGGNSGATYTHDFFELYNTTENSVTIGGWSIQYYAATGTGASSNVIVIPDGKYIPAKSHFLIQSASGGAVGVALPTPDATGTVNAAAAAGKVILYTTNAAQTINSSDITSITGNGFFKDYVPFGTTATPVWGSAMSSGASNTTSATRKKVEGEYVYTQNIGNDFEVASPNPQNTGIVSSTDNPSSLTSIYAHNAKIHFAATAGEKVEVYNAVGQKIISTLATDGQNELPVNAKGVMIVKVGSRLAKVIL